MKKFTVLVLLFLIITSLTIVVGCGLQGPALSTSNIIDGVKLKNNKALLALCTKSAKDYINSGFTKDIYGKNLPLDYLVTLVSAKNLDDAKIEILEEKGNSAVTKVVIKDKTAYFFLQKEKDKWLFDMAKTITLAGADPKNKIISGVEKSELTFNKNDYPTTVGLETRYFSHKQYDDNNNQLPPAQVSFNLEGPWDFSTGPADDEVVTTVIDKTQAPDMASFPAANLVDRTDVGQVYDDAYWVNDQEGLKLLGEANHYMISKVPTVYTYTPPWFLLKYPLKKGLTWQDSYQNTEAGFGAGASCNINRTSRVVAVNQIKTPFKSYDRCFLVQVRKEELKPTGTVGTYWYGWYVPNVGCVVEIKSVDGEVNEVFTQAQRFRRLKFQGQEKPVGTPQN